MCGIIGIFNHSEALEQVKLGLSILKNRGKDGFGVAHGAIEYQKDLAKFSKTESKNVLGHSLHAVVENIPQPLKRKGTLVANCEIYNWQELNQKYKFGAKNDAELLLLFLDEFGTEKITELDGVFAFAYWLGDKVILARDIIGEKPLWYAHNTENFAFASEKKALEKIGYLDIQELNPRQILVYTVSTNSLETQHQSFLTYLPEHKGSFEEIKEHTKNRLDAAIKKRIPDCKFGLLFSGGIDSTYLAHYFKEQGYDFTSYTAVLDSDGVIPSDLTSAQKAAKELGLKLKIKKIKINEIPSYLKKIVPLIEDSNVVKVGVALTFYLACEMAKEDGCKVIFSGLGSEEIFAGYDRHKNSANINQECVSGLLKMYERDLYRDDVLTMDNNLELRLPFLDLKLADYALKIPERYKIKENLGKWILRQIAQEKGIPLEFTLHKKTAAQYGSRFDNALGKLAKLHKFPTKSAYLRTFYPSHNLKLGLLFSGGKDSLYAAYIMQKQNYELTCLITLQSSNPNSFMFHTPAINIVPLQAEALRLPLIVQETKGEKEAELKDLENALALAKREHKIDGVITGAVFSTYQRDRIEKICDKLGLKIFSPLWHKPQEEEVLELLENKFEFIFTAVAGEGLDKSWLNKKITLVELEKLKKLNVKYGVHVAGEGGELESLVLDCPLFKKKLVLEEVEIKEENKNTARLMVQKAKLVEK